MDWYDHGEIYLHVTLTVLINFRWAQATWWPLNQDLILACPILVASVKMDECRLTAFSFFCYCLQGTALSSVPTTTLVLY